MSIFRKIFGAKREDDEATGEIRLENKITSNKDSTENQNDTRSQDSPFVEKNARLQSSNSLLSPSRARIEAADELAHRFTSGISELAGSLKVISENIAEQRVMTDTLSKNSRRQIELLEEIGGGFGRLSESSNKDDLRKIIENLQKEMEIVSNMEGAISASNEKLSLALDQISKSLQSIPEAESKQAALLETLKNHMEESGNVKKMIYALAESIQNQSRSNIKVSENIRDSIKEMGQKLESQNRFRNILLVLIFIAAAIAVILVVT